MGVKKAKNIGKISEQNFTKRMKEMVDKKNEYIKVVDTLHVYIAKGNSKTGEFVPSVSLIPVYNCLNCAQCRELCYDLRNDCCYPGCRDKRSVNAAILEADPSRYFKEISEAAKEFSFFRWHIGGDIVSYEYLMGMIMVATQNPHCEFLAFTKSFDIVNTYLDKYNLPKNLHIIFSAWVGLEMDNRHNLPTSNPLFFDGRTTAHDGAVYCSGNCSDCAKTGTGCWTMKNGDEVIFPAH